MKFESIGIKNKEVINGKKQTERIFVGEEDLLEKKIEEEILPILRILEDDEESFQNNKKEFIEKLFKDVEHIEETEGRLVPNPDYTAKKMKEVLISRLKNAIEGSENNYNRKKKIDYNLVKKAKIILLSEKDDSFVKKIYPLGIDDDWDTNSLFNYLGLSRYDSKVEKLNGVEINALIRGGLGHILAKITQYDYSEHIKETPDEYLQMLIKENNRYVDFENIIKNTASPLGYSLETAKALMKNDKTYTVMRNLELFEKSLDVEFVKSLFTSYSPQYPYHLKDCLGYLDKLNWDENKKNELRDFVYKNNYVTEKGEELELEGKLKDVNEGIKSITRIGSNTWKKVNIDSLSEEQLGKLRKYIEDGYITLFYDDFEYIKYFSINNYNWLISQIEKNNQENLLLVYRGGDVVYKHEDQRRYAKKLLDKNNLEVLQKLIKEGRFSNNIFNNDDFNILKEKGLNPEKNIRLFSSLEEENFEAFKEDEINNYRYNQFLINNVKKFNFESEKYEKEKSYKEFIANVNKCFNNNTEKFIPYFYEKFSFDNYDIDKKDELIKYISDLSVFLEKIARNAYAYQFEVDKDYDWTKVGTAILDKDTHFQNAPLEQCLGQNEYDTLKNYGIKMDSYAKISFFNGLSEETFESLVTESTTWSTYSAMIKRFNLSENSIYSKIYNEAKSIIDNNELQEYYFKNYFKETDEKRQEIIELINQGLSFSSNSNLVIRFVDNFNKDKKINIDIYNETIENFNKYEVSDKIKSNYFDILINGPINKIKSIFYLFEEVKKNKERDEEFIIFYIDRFIDEDINSPESISHREEFSREYNISVETISKNKPIFIEDEVLYKNICKEVYPERNYNTYANLSQYKDRSEDLNLYSFEREGYSIRLSGVVGYRVKEGFEKNPELLANYQQRIKNIEKLAMRMENIHNFIDSNFNEIKSTTIEGKLIECIQKNEDKQAILDLLLAYQLNGHYDQFIRESADRTDMYEQMEGKEYIMLAELSERYGDLKKKIIKSLINTFQQIQSIKPAAEIFAKKFNKENFANFKNLFSEEIKEIINGVNFEIINDIKRIEPIRQKVYEEIKGELDKYEEIKEVDDNKNEVKMSKERSVKGYFSKNKENAHARMVGDICIAVNVAMLENKNYFEFVMFDESRQKCVGTNMLLRMEEPGNKKYLLYCPNPSVDLVSQVSAEKLYKLITKEISTFAKNNNFDGVLVDKRHGHATNRSGLFQASLEKSVRKSGNGEEIIYNLENNRSLSNNYTYQKNLNAIWLK